MKLALRRESKPEKKLLRVKKAAVFDDCVKRGRIVFFHNTKRNNNIPSASSQENLTKETRENSEESLRYVKQ